MSATTIELVDAQGNEYPLLVGMGGSLPSTHPLVCTSWDLGYPDVRENVNLYTGQSGTDDNTLFYGGSTVTLNVDVKDGAIAGSAYGTMSRHAWIDRIQAMCNVRFRPYLYIQAEGWAQRRRTLLRTNRLSFLADSPAWRKIPVTMTFSRNNMQSVDPVEGVIHSASTVSGRSYNKSYAWSYNPGTSTDFATLTNAGSEYASPIFYIYGACTNPRIQNRNTGEVIAFSGITVPEGHYIEVNVKKRTVLLDSTISVYTNLNLTTSSWWQLAPGDNSVQFIASSRSEASQLSYRFYSEWV